MNLNHSASPPPPATLYCFFHLQLNSGVFLMMLSFMRSCFRSLYEHLVFSYVCEVSKPQLNSGLFLILLNDYVVSF